MKLLEATATFASDSLVLLSVGDLASFPAVAVSNDNIARMGESIDMALIRAEERRIGKRLPLFDTAEQIFRARPGLGYSRRP